MESEQRGGAKARPTKIAQGIAALCGGLSALTDPALETAVCGGGLGLVGGCDYRPTGGLYLRAGNSASGRRNALCNDEGPALRPALRNAAPRLSGVDRRV